MTNRGHAVCGQTVTMPRPSAAFIPSEAKDPIIALAYRRDCHHVFDAGCGGLQYRIIPATRPAHCGVWAETQQNLRNNET